MRQYVISLCKHLYGLSLNQRSRFHDYAAVIPRRLADCDPFSDAEAKGTSMT